MKIFRPILDFYINTSIHVAFAVFSLVQVTRITLNISTNLEVDLFIFFGTIFGYNFLKYFEVFQKKVFSVKKNYPILIVTIFALFGLLFYFFKLEFQIKLAFLAISIVVFAYPFLRKYGFLKMFIVAICITYITVYVPSLILNWNDKLGYLMQRLLVVLCLLIPFEIVDQEIDAKTLVTLPHKIGIQNTKLAGYFLLLIAYFFVQLDLIITLVICVFIFFSNANRSKYYTSFWTESLPILWWLLLWYKF